MRIKRLVKLKFASAQDEQVVERLADMCALTLEQFVMEAVFEKSQRVIREIEIQKSQQAKESNSGQVSIKDTSRVDDGGQKDAGSTALAEQRDQNN